MEEAAAFAVELEDVALQLSSLDPQPTTPDALASLAAQAASEYGRLAMTAELYGKPSVQAIAAWIGGLLNNFQADLPEAIVELLQGGQLTGWLELAAAALRDPTDNSLLPALYAALQDEAWPEPLPPELLESLLLELHPQTQAAQALPATSDDTTDEATPPATAAESTTATSTAARTEPSGLTWADDIHPELLAAYLQETPEQISEAARLIRLIAQNQHTPAQKRQAARLAHTIKGASGVVGVAAIAHFTHRLEDILECNITPHLDAGLGHTLTTTADCLESLFEHLQERRGLPVEYQHLLAELETWEQRLLAAQTPDDLRTQADWTDREAEALRPPPVPYIPDLLAAPASQPAETEPTPETARPTHLSVPTASIEQLLSLAGELVTTTTQLSEYSQQLTTLGKRLHQQDGQIRQLLEQLGHAIEQQARHTLPDAHTTGAAPDPLELEAYNELQSNHNLLTEALADSRELLHNLQQQLRQLTEQTHQQQRLQRQLNETILRTRLVPMQSLVARLERTVRETCRRTGKQADIHIHGQELQIDTDILNGLTAPLLHMLRNAVDHGIEPPDQRAALGKPAAGRIDLYFAQHGNQIHVTLQDDGQGLDTQRIRARAIERGLLAPDADYPEQELWRLILQPGFTTRDQTSDISGRGVGMDVVHAAVENLQGTLELHSTAGQGTTIQLQLPLTLVATHALLVRCAGNLVAIPTNTIQQLLHVTAQEHSQQAGQWQIPYRGGHYPVHLLANLLGWDATPPDLTRNQTLILANHNDKLYPLYAETILQPRDIVVKSLSPWLNLTQGVSGACILPDGAVAPVLDTFRLLRHLENGTLTLGGIKTASAQTAPAQARILVVDDSLSNRKALSLMLEGLGYSPITAIDGMDALQQLHTHAVELILTDMEMPRMNGLEMTQSIRIWPEKRHIPVIMITSRNTQKHRSMAQQAGVNAYLTKPVGQDTLQQHIQQWLGNNPQQASS